MMTLECFNDALKLALDMLYYKDQYLISNRMNKHVSELSISHKLGHYLALLIDKYDVDCEYNRNLADPKSEEANNLIRPDIIVHKRGSNDDNFVIIEIKPWWNDNTEKDVKKLYEMTKQDGQFRYCFGFSILIDKNRGSVITKIIENGKIKYDDIQI